MPKFHHITQNSSINTRLGRLSKKNTAGNYIVYSSFYLKYGFYKPREVKNRIKKRVRKQEFLYMIFYLPRFLNPIWVVFKKEKQQKCDIGAQNSNYEYTNETYAIYL